MSLFMENYLITVASFILLVWATYIPFRAGQLYNGPIYSMAIGGYFSVLVVRDFNWPFALALIATVFVCCLFGLIPALGFVRTSGVATAMGSMALIFIVQSVIRNTDFLGGTRGLWNIPRLDHIMPFDYDLVIISYIIVLIVGLIVYRLDNSRFGRALETILVDPNLAATMGIDVKKYSLFALTISSVIGGLAGVIFAFNLNTIYPDSFGFFLLLYVWTMLYVGGRYTMWGALIVAPILWGFPHWIPLEYAKYTKFMYGALLIIILYFRPEGIITRSLLKRLASFSRIGCR